MRYRSGISRAEILALTAIFAVAVALVIQIIGRQKGTIESDEKLIQCQDNLRKIGAGLLLYAQDHGGNLPETSVIYGPHRHLLSAIMPDYVSDERLLYCPAETQPHSRYSKPNIETGIIGYFYFGAQNKPEQDNMSRFLKTDVTWPRKIRTQDNPQTWLMSDIWENGLPTSHHSYKKGVNYLILSGDVHFVAESPRQAFR